MVDRRSLWLLLPRPLRALPADLACMLAITVLVNVAVFAPVVRELPFRVPVGLVFVLFVPGYVFIAALFPEAGESPAVDSSSETAMEGSDSDSDSGWGQQTAWGTDSTTDETTAETDSETTPIFDSPLRTGIDGIERVALAFGLSIAITPLIGLALNFTPWGIRLTPIMVATTGFTLAMTSIAAIRRWQLPAEERFRVPYRDWYRSGRAEFVEPDSRFDGVLNVLLVLSLLLAVSSVAFAVVVPPQGEQFSAVYILTEDDDGDLVADGYPTEFVQGESEEIVLGVDNNEHRSVEYTVVALEQETEFVSNETNTTTATSNASVNETVVTEQRELDRFETRLGHNESWHHTHDVEPTMVGEDIRVVWLLYPDGEVPDEPSIDDTEYYVHLWVDVAESTPAETE